MSLCLDVHTTNITSFLRGDNALFMSFVTLSLCRQCEPGLIVPCRDVHITSLCYVYLGDHALLVDNYFPYIWCPFGLIMRGSIAVLGKPSPERVSSLILYMFLFLFYKRNESLQNGTSGCLISNSKPTSTGNTRFLCTLLKDPFNNIIFVWEVHVPCREIVLWYLFQAVANSSFLLYLGFMKS